MTRPILCLFILTFCVVALPALSMAACSDPIGNEGSIIYNADENVPQVCTPLGWVALGVLNPGAGGSGCTNPTGTEGTAVYNGDIHAPQYCDGDDWITMIGAIGSGCNAPQDCPNVGDVCADGSLFAGFMAATDGACRVVYVTNDNQSTSAQWKNATGTDDISSDSYTDGRVNHTNRGGAIGDFEAFDLCESNTYHGKSDWYLPARSELDLLYLNRSPIDANAAGNFTTGSYWASTEIDTSNVWRLVFSTGDHSNSGTKDGFSGIRCIRSVDSMPAASGSGGGCAAPASCPNVGDVCSDGSQFAGFILYDGASCEALYVTDNNQSAATAWHNTGGANYISPDSHVDGRLNAANRSGAIANFPAFDLCESNTYHGKNDWYLPAHDELELLWKNRAAINVNAAGSFTTQYYWSSTEATNFNAWAWDFNEAYNDQPHKGSAYDVRCVRRD